MFFNYFLQFFVLFLNNIICQCQFNQLFHLELVMFAVLVFEVFHIGFVLALEMVQFGRIFLTLLAYFICVLGIDLFDIFTILHFQIFDFIHLLFLQSLNLVFIFSKDGCVVLALTFHLRLKLSHLLVGLALCLM